MDINRIKLVAFDLDGTLTQHKTPLSAEHRAILTELSKKYKLLMAGAGMCQRIFNQMEKFPIDILGNYGLQYAEYRAETGEIEIVENLTFPCDRESVDKLSLRRGQLLLMVSDGIGETVALRCCMGSIGKTPKEIATTLLTATQPQDDATVVTISLEQEEK